MAFTNDPSPKLESDLNGLGRVKVPLGPIWTIVSFDICVSCMFGNIEYLTSGIIEQKRSNVNDKINR